MDARQAGVLLNSASVMPIIFNVLNSVVVTPKNENWVDVELEYASDEENDDAEDEP